MQYVRDFARRYRISRNAGYRRKSKVEADIVQVQQELELDGMQLINNRCEGNCLFQYYHALRRILAALKARRCN
ncbi:MAG: hypothetical protein EZS28_016214 [Streblomastix strix]|uniref:Uncharacterized protein n=1 Tax=Streblomastix strix TaxID=222440 RepID=A0A5J4W015_9EUKA|nr:MAG: hypothetical protein EZS28_016214 [Streblomastix strix]